MQHRNELRARGMTRRRFIAGVAAASGAAAIAGAAEAASTDVRVRAPEAGVEVLDIAEIAIEGVPAAGNVFDPNEIALDLEARAPSGAVIRLPGFSYQDFERALRNDREVLTPKGAPAWRVRYAPREPGRHTLEVTVRAAGKEVARGAGRLEVKAAARPGFARVETTGRRYFRLEDGMPLFLNGLCACWHGQRGSYDYDDWLPAYRDAGINYIRLWMWPVAFGIECEQGDRLKYRLDRAWVLDRVLSEARARGIFVMLCFDYHGMYEEKPDFWGGNNRWPQHPYNIAHGGPCATQNEFFTLEAARALYRARVRYIVARWTAFTNILAWEFFNEIDNVYKYLTHADVVSWHRDMARHLRSIDPYEHCISSSFTGGSERGDLFNLPEMDFAQYHSYNENHPADMMAQKTTRFFDLYKKPFFVSEYGTDWRGWKPEGDPYLRALHQAIWSGVFTGAAGTAMSWWWEHVHSQKLHQHWAALSAFLKGSALAAPDMKPIRVEAKDVAKVKAFGVATGREALVWLLDPAFNWPDGAKVATPPVLEGATAAFTGLDDGVYEVAWWDTLAGKVIATQEARVQSGRIALTPPPFKVDVAARIRRR